jgi:hypothetical protein
VVAVSKHRPIVLPYGRLGHIRILVCAFRMCLLSHLTLTPQSGHLHIGLMLVVILSEVASCGLRVYAWMCPEYGEISHSEEFRDSW